jgi:tetratricopeptide (TPR) repeat protein
MPRADLPERKQRRRIFAALLPFLLALPVCLLCAEVKLERTAERVELSGGQGAKAWRIVYGTETRARISAVVATVSPSRAYFAHGCWLRLLDAENGKVIGRWHLPGEIKALKPAGGDWLDVACEEGPPSLVPFQNYRFNPSHPKLPQVSLENLLIERLSQKETASVAEFDLWKAGTFPGSEAQARRALAGADELIRRDPLAPWFVLARARLLEMMNDPGAKQAYRSVLDVPGSDFIEWFRIANFLARQADRDLYEAAWQRAYRDYIQSDHDPRLFLALITRLILFPPVSDVFLATEERRRDYIERTYRMAPYAEGAATAWALYARQLEKSGPPELAALWHTRAADARVQGTFGLIEFGRRFDQWMLVYLGGLIAALLYFIVVNRSYSAQRRIDTATGRRRWSLLGSANVRYWARRQKLGLLAIALLCWLALGLAAGYFLAFLRIAPTPLSPWAGNFSGPYGRWYFKRLPASPARDLLLAQALLQSGDSAGAEQMYRRLPDYSQAWNNLGVLLKKSGKETQAPEAFERALQLDPQLHEAALNLGRPPADFWTEQHARFAPGQPMLAPVPLAVVREAHRGPLGRFLEDALLGPMHADHIFWGLNYASEFGWSTVVRKLVYPLAAATALLLLGSVFLLFLPPAQVTEGADRAQRVLEKALPGTSMRWSALGGLALACWCLLLIQVTLYITLDTPYLFCKTCAMVNVQKAFFINASGKQAMMLVNPTWPWLYGAPVALFAGNLLLLRRKTSGKATTAAT